MDTAFLDMARRILPLPTAPYCEHFVIDEVLAIAGELPGVRYRRDGHGNVRLAYDGAAAGPRLVVTAHLDHPGLVYGARLSARDALFEKGGGIPVDLARDAAVRVYHLAGGGDQTGQQARITSYCDADSAVAQSRGLQTPAFGVRLGEAAGAELGPGSFAMLDLKPFQVRGHRVRSRACDDLGGAAVGLAWLAQVCHSGADCPCGLLLTRAEEVGFGGMVAAVEEGDLERDAVYVNVECSGELPTVRLGDGPVIRVGDRAWTFSPEVSAALASAAESLAAAGGDGAFRCQRQLMDRGTCEATVLAGAGYRTGAAALPLRHYHNHGGDRLRAEAIDRRDADNLVRLLVELATRPGGVGQALDEILERMDRQMRNRYARHGGRLRQTAGNAGATPEEIAP